MLIRSRSGGAENGIWNSKKFHEWRISTEKCFRASSTGNYDSKKISKASKVFFSFECRERMTHKSNRESIERNHLSKHAEERAMEGWAGWKKEMKTLFSRSHKMKNKKILPSVKGNDFSQKKYFVSSAEFVWMKLEWRWWRGGWKREMKSWNLNSSWKKTFFLRSDVRLEGIRVSSPLHTVQTHS